MECYVTTEIFDIMAKDAFCKQLHAVQKNFPESDIVIVMDGFYTKVDSDILLRYIIILVTVTVILKGLWTSAKFTVLLSPARLVGFRLTSNEHLIRSAIWPSCSRLKVNESKTNNS